VSLKKNKTVEMTTSLFLKLSHAYCFRLIQRELFTLLATQIRSEMTSHLPITTEQIEVHEIVFYICNMAVCNM